MEGFLTFADRPKAGASIAQLQRLEVQVKIITGDNGLVAAKVCADIGVQSRPSLPMLLVPTGAALVGAVLPYTGLAHLLASRRCRPRSSCCCSGWWSSTCCWSSSRRQAR